MTSPVVGGARSWWERLPEGGSALQPVGRETRHVTPDARWWQGVVVREGAGREASALRAPWRPTAEAAPVNWGVQAAQVTELGSVRESRRFSHTFLRCSAEESRLQCQHAGSFSVGSPARVFLSFPEREPLIRGTGRVRVQIPTGEEKRGVGPLRCVPEPLVNLPRIGPGNTHTWCERTEGRQRRPVDLGRQEGGRQMNGLLDKFPRV